MATLELTYPLDSAENLQSAREHKQGEKEYLGIPSEFGHLGVSSFCSTIELSALGHYLSCLSSLHTCINFINEGSISKLTYKTILDLAASKCNSASRRIFLAKDCCEWTFEC